MKKNVVKVAYHTIVWLFFHFLRPITCTKWAVATDEKCVFTVSGNWTILFEVHPSLFVTYLAASSPLACRTSCCDHHSCNGYVYDSSSVLDSCKLLKCSREGLDCKDALVRYDKNARGEVGFITGLADNSNEASRSSTASSADTHTTHQHHDPSSVKSNTSVEKVQEKQKNGGEANVDERTSVGLNTAVAAPEEVGESGLNNLTYYANELLEYREDIKEHTNSISLTIAFIFGMAFLITVLCLTGRRWLEGLKEGQQKGYTRISYLLNGV